MLKISLSLFLLFLCSLVLGQNLIELTQNNFDRLVTNSEAPWVVAFVAPWCGHCQRLKPEYEKAANSLGGVVNMGTINCDNEKELAQRFGIKGFPTIKLFPAYKSSKLNPDDYQGGRDANSIVNAALGLMTNLKDPVKVLNNEEEIKTFITNKEIGEDEINIIKVILFSSKTSNPNLFKSLAFEYIGKKVDFGFVGENKATDLFGLTTTPALVLFKNNNLEDKIIFDGKLKKLEMLKFIDKHIERGEREVLSKKRKSTPTTTILKERITTIEKQEHLKQCEKVVCIIGFVNNQVNGQVELFKKISERYPDETFIYLQAIPNTDAYETLQKVFEFEDTTPNEENEKIDLVVFRGHKLKYVKKMKTTLTEASLFIDRVIGGDIQYTRLFNYPTIVTSKDEL
ncbi:hypothetical protein ABK040_000632 [Willaertia magna]